jgi:hypothetical protein
MIVPRKTQQSKKSPRAGNKKDEASSSQGNVNRGEISEGRLGEKGRVIGMRDCS